MSSTSRGRDTVGRGRVRKGTEGYGIQRSSNKRWSKYTFIFGFVPISCNIVVRVFPLQNLVAHHHIGPVGDDLFKFSEACIREEMHCHVRVWGARDEGEECVEGCMGRRGWGEGLPREQRRLAALLSRRSPPARPPFSALTFLDT